MKNKKVFIIGLDCATPQLVFNEYRSELKNINKLMENGTYTLMKSTIPPITVPAWTSMMTSKSPGSLGFYGFRNRKNYSYDELFYATNSAVRDKRFWDLLSDKGYKIIAVGVPQTYPPKPVNGFIISSFLAPGTESNFTYPTGLKHEIFREIGDYIIDVRNFRTEDKKWLLEQIYKMTELRFKTIRYLMKTKEWDFFMFVEMGIDRLHHGFWKYFDKEHPKYEPNNEYETAGLEYYKYVDEEIGKCLELLDSNTTIIVVSDHGAKKMLGGFCLNEWLIKEGYLTVKEYPKEMKQLKNDNIVWEKTKAWGSGGYYGRLFLNVEGREPKGTIPSLDYYDVLEEIKEKLESIKLPDGENMKNKVFIPEDVYPKVNGVPPDLIIYFGDLYWRSVGSIGINSIFTSENDTGPDDANHQEEGIFIFYDDEIKLSVENNSVINILDIAPTLCDVYDFSPPKDWEGKSLI